MARKRDERLDAYLRALNRAYVTRDGEPLSVFYADERDREADRAYWMREQDQDRRREIHPLAGRLTVLPLYRASIGHGRAETAMVMHHQLYYKQRDAVFLQENRRIQRLSMKRRGDEWAFLWPWGWYFDKRHLDGSDGESAAEKASPKGEWSPDADRSSEAGGTGSEAERTDKDCPATSDADRRGIAEGETFAPVRGESLGGGYDRERAVAYAERYWNTPNPAYPYFQVDCTNFVSQCLHAGGLPMRYTGNRGSGWWIRGGSWSYSWAVAHSLYLLLKSGAAPMRALEVDHPSELQPGDVICYDFDGDGRWQHNTIVVTYDVNGMPLVNAHTTNSRHRYWAYRDSSAYTPRIRYAFFHIRG